MKARQLMIVAFAAGLVTACASIPTGDFVTAPSTPAPEGMAGTWLMRSASLLGVSDAIINLYLTPSGQYASCYEDYQGEATQRGSGKLTTKNGKLYMIASGGLMSDVRFSANTMEIKRAITYVKAERPTANCYKLFKDRGMIE